MSLETPRRRRNAGFTIVELIFTVMIAAILFAVAIPSFRGMMASNRIVTQTNELIGAVNFARSEAITRNRTMTFCRADSIVAVTCSTSAGNWGFWIIRNAADEVARRGEVPNYANTVRVTSTLTLDRIDFGADGLARTSAGTLLNNQQIVVCSTFNAGENRRGITLGSSSRVTVGKSSTAGVC